MRREPNYKLKAAILQEADQVIVHKYDTLDYEKVGFLEALDIEEEYKELQRNLGLNYLKECRRINNAYFARKKRLKDRVMDLIHKGTCIFATLTFTDEVMASTKLETRRKYVQRYLKSISDYYVANIDYGVDDNYTHREHYHALICVDYISDKWDYGYTWFEKVRSHSNPKKISKYIAKLTNHAIKDSTKRQCYIYSRCKK